MALFGNSHIQTRFREDSQSCRNLVQGLAHALHMAVVEYYVNPAIRAAGDEFAKIQLRVYPGSQYPLTKEYPLHHNIYYGLYNLRYIP